MKIEYLTGLLTNISFAPISPYVVFDDTPDLGRPLGDFVAVPFTRGPQGEGRDPRVITPGAAVRARQPGIRDVPAAELPRVFPTAVEVEKRDGELRLAALPAVEAPAELTVRSRLRGFLPGVRTSTRRPRRQALPTAAARRRARSRASRRRRPTSSRWTAQGIRIVGASPAGVFYGLQSLRSLLPAPAPGKGLVLDALVVRDAPRFGYRGFMLDVARNFQPKAGRAPRAGPAWRATSSTPSTST